MVTGWIRAVPNLADMQKTFSLLLALALLIAACSGEEAAESTSTSLADATSTSSSTATSSTTSTVAPTTTEAGDRSLINGLPVESPELLERRVLAVKIDNHPRANPQSGINEADMVIELLVEGITRYLSIWHESDSDYLGPMRSGRPTDPTILAGMNEPTFAISGAQNWVQQLIRSMDVRLIGEVVRPQTFRVSGRSAPHNLYVDTNALRDYADDREYPNEPPAGPLWPFGPMSDLAEPVTEITIDFSGNTVVWNWDEEAGKWFRTGYGEPTTYRDQEGNEEPLGVPVMVALYVDQYTVSPPSGVSGSALPSSRTTGSGAAFVFADGKVTEGTWEREAETEWFTLRDENGEVMLVPPGKVWVSMVPSSRGLTYR